MMPKKTDFDPAYFSDYQDRGIKKWQGMYLSEHTAELEKAQQQEEKVIPAKRAMAEAEIQQLLALAYQ